MQTIDASNIQLFITSQLQDVFETMFSTAVTPNSRGGPEAHSEHVSGSVGYAGEAITGAVYLHLPARFATVLAACMLGTSVQEVTDGDVNDVVGEMTNMVTGGFKSWLCDRGATCAVSTPGIIRGNSFAVEPAPDVERLCLGFSSGANRFSVEIHYKFQ